jgi:hypothetical protein
MIVGRTRHRRSNTPGVFRVSSLGTYGCGPWWLTGGRLYVSRGLLLPIATVVLGPTTTSVCSHWNVRMLLGRMLGLVRALSGCMGTRDIYRGPCRPPHLRSLCATLVLSVVSPPVHSLEVQLRVGVEAMIGRFKVAYYSGARNAQLPLRHRIERTTTDEGGIKRGDAAVLGVMAAVRLGM